MEVNGWSNFFVEIVTLIESAQRQFGIANINYSEYVMDRLELSISSSSSLLETIANSAVRAELQDCCSSITELIECLRVEYRRWGAYKMYLEGSGDHLPLLATRPLGGRGRPRFEVSKSQIEYLESLSFKWTEIASVLGISRMTLYRYNYLTFSNMPIG